MYNWYINVRNVFIKHYFYFLILGVIFTIVSLVIIVKMPEKQILEYGSWPSSLTSDKLFGGTCKAIKEIQVSGDSIFWVEQQFSGQCVLYQHSGKSGEEPILWTNEDINVKNTVHEYGGGSFIPIGEKGVLVANNGGIYSLDKPLADPKSIVEFKDEDIRHADFYVHGDYVYAIREKHFTDHHVEPENLLIRAKLSERKEEVLASGSDFYIEPRVSPNGKFVAWTEWNKPNMPWDKTTIHIRKINDDGTLGEIVHTLSSPSNATTPTNYHGIQWRATEKGSTLYVISDETGWWNVYEIEFDEKGVHSKNLYPIDKEIGQPIWFIAAMDRQYSVNSEIFAFTLDDKILYKRFDSIESQPVEIKTPGFSSFSQLSLTTNNILYVLASGPARPSTLLKINLKTNEVDIIKETRDHKELEEFDISVPEVLEFDSDGVKVYGYFYKPYSSKYEAPKDTLPPVLFKAHGGPTARTDSTLELRIQYYTSRGYAVFDVNHRGSTGYGTKYRNMLYTNWGVVDRNDMINGAKFLAKAGKVDPKKICITGQSAGGFLVLGVMRSLEKLFAAGVSFYGVAELEGLVKNTEHKFEQSYPMTLIAPYPEGIDVYNERSPYKHIDEINTPVAFIHGTADPIVPFVQSQQFFEALKKKGIPTALMAFEGEIHGFKSAETVKKATDAAYYFLCKIMGINPSVHSDIEIVNL